MVIGDKFYVDAPALSDSVHGQQTCAGCHGGDPKAPAKSAAHQGMNPDPSADVQHACGSAGCHTTKAQTFPTTLHATLQGFTATMQARTDPAHWAALSQAIGPSCGYCHATCGQCHVSQPAAVGGGLLAAHAFVDQPPVERTCQACHGRVVEEYLGTAGGMLPDVHVIQAHLTCLDCHPGAAFHGDGQQHVNRYDKPLVRPCESCHAQAVSGDSGIIAHDRHAGQVDCFTCHAQPYTNCYGCHGTRTASGDVVFASQREERSLKIGKLPGEVYGLVRHVPVSRDTFAAFGSDLLPRFDDVPTWKRTTPHNTQRQTTQNANCLACHGTPEVWLQPSDLEPGDSRANQSVATEPVRPIPTPR